MGMEKKHLLMEILITGASGFLGKHLVFTLGKEHILETFHRKDFEQLNRIQNYKISKSYDLVIHAMGKAHKIPDSLNEDCDFYRVNVLNTINLLNSLGENLPKSFVYISSVSVYGKSEGELISENCPTLANEPYGLSKLIAERIIKTWCCNNNIKCTILRLPLIVGDNPPGNLGSMINSINRGTFFIFKNGIAKKSMVLATDISNYIIAASNAGGIFNLTDGYHPSFRELSKSISLINNKRVPRNFPFIFAKILAFIGDIVGRTFPINSKILSKMTTNLTFDDSLAKNTFGWRPHTAISFYQKISMSNE
jgi:nucleoside-diphosphate-sugar epimerase